MLLSAQIFINSIDQAALLFNSDCQVIHLNAEAENLLGRSLAELTGFDLQALFPYSELFNKEDLDQHFNSLAEDRPLLNVELKAVRRDGRKVPVNAKLFKVQLSDSSENAPFFAIIFGAWRKTQDSSTQKTSNVKTAILPKQAEEELVNNEFIGMAVHDLRTPVHRITLASEVLLGGNCTPDKTKEFLQMVFRSARSMTYLIDDLLDLTKFRSGKIKLRKERIKVKDYISDICKSNYILAKQKEIKLIADVKNAPEYATLDRKRITQVCNNLLSNAYKFSDKNTNVILSAREVSDHLEISVKDEGQGIEEQEQAKLFQAFHRVDSNHPTAGEHSTGLGLAISRKIVELHGGAIGVDSKAGKGSRFYFTLPLE